MARYEELKTPEAVLAAFKAGRRVERSANEGRRWTLLCTVSGVAAYIQSGWRYRALIESPAIPAGYTEQAQPSQQGEAVPTFDAGLLNDFGGGNVEWWHDYIRSLLSDAEEHYRQYIAAPAEPLGRAADGVEGLANIGEMDLTAPPSVWLQIDADGDPEDRSQPVPRGEWVNLTWHYESIGGQEVVYIREDIARRLRPQVDDAAIEAALDQKIGLDNTLRQLIRGDTMAIGYSKVDVVRALLTALGFTAALTEAGHD